jgi:hypothetical protein
MRAVVFVAEDTPKGTARSAQEYQHPLLVLTGEAYANMTFDNLYTHLCEALRGGKPRIVAQYLAPGGLLRLLFEDGTAKEIDVSGDTHLVTGPLPWTRNNSTTRSPGSS